MGSLIAYGATLISVLPDIVKGVQGAIEVWNAGSKNLDRMVAEKRDPTAEEWADLNHRIDELRRDLHTDDPDELV